MIAFRCDECGAAGYPNQLFAPGMTALCLYCRTHQIVCSRTWNTDDTRLYWRNFYFEGVPSTLDQVEGEGWEDDCNASTAEPKGSYYYQGIAQPGD